MKSTQLILCILIILTHNISQAAESIGRNLIRKSENQTKTAYFNEYGETLNLPNHDTYFKNGALRLDYFPGIDMAPSTSANDHDDTASFKNALNFCRDNDLALYIPEGTVDITDTIALRGIFQPRAWPPHNLSGTHVRTFNIIGAKYDESIIRLKNSSNTSSFNDPNKPKKMIVVWQPEKKDFETHYNDGAFDGPIKKSMISDEYGEDNGSLFSFTLKNVILDTGNHPGAIAIKAVGAQNYLVSDVTVRGESFYCGFYGIPGNAAVVRGLTIDGGQYGIMGFKETITISGKNYLYGGNKKNPLFISTLLKNQSVAAIYFKGDRAAQAAATFVGFEIYPPTLTANAIKIDDTTKVGMNHLCLLDGFVQFPSGSTNTMAINNKQSSIYISNVTFYNADTIMRSKNDGGSSVEKLLGGNEYILVNEYSQVNQIKDPKPRPAFQGGDRENIAIDGTTNILVEEHSTPVASAPPPGYFLTLHFDGRTAPHVDDPDYINVCDHDGDGIYYETGSAVDPNHFGHDEIDPRNGDASTDDVIIQAILDNATKVFLPKGVYYLKNGLRLNEKNTLFGIDNSYTLLVQSKTWRSVGPDGTADFMIDTVNHLGGKAYLADLYLLMDNRASKVSRLGYVRWRQGPASTISCVNSTTFRLGGGDSTKQVHSWSFVDNCGGKVYGLDRVNSMPNNNGIYGTYIDSTNNLHIYGLSIESGVGPNAQVCIDNSNHVYLYGAKAEEGTPVSNSAKSLPNTIHIENSNDVGVFSCGGKDVFEKNGAKISFKNSDRLAFANISKNFNRITEGGNCKTHEPFHYYLIDDLSAGGVSVPIDQVYTTTPEGYVDESANGFKWPETMIPLYKKGILNRISPEVSYGNIKNIYNLLQFHNTTGNPARSEYNLKNGKYFPKTEGSLSMFIKCDNWSIGSINILNSYSMISNDLLVIKRQFNNPVGYDKLQVQFYEGGSLFAQRKLTVKDASTTNLSGAWIHVVATWQPGEQKIYFSYQNGSSQVFHPSANGFNAGTDENWTPSNIQNVLLDGVSNGNIHISKLKLFPEALNVNEIAELYKADNPDLW